MNPYANPQAYRQASVLTATPAQLVVMLYDGVGRFLRQAEVAFGEGAWAHAYLHRVEGDLRNAGGWYSRAGRPASTAPLKEEWETIARALLA